MPTKRKERSDSSDDSNTMETSLPSPSDPDQLLAKAKAELSSLLRVSHRLALVDTSAKLMAVLDKLLPRLLHRIGENHSLQQSCSTTTKTDTPSNLMTVYNQIHTTLVEMLSHTIKRVKDDAAVQLPCESILQLLLQQPQVEQGQSPDVTDHADFPVSNLASVDAYTLNLSLAFLLVGVPRLQNAAVCEALLPSLLVLLRDGRRRLFHSTAATTQYGQIKHLVVLTLERLAATSSTVLETLLRTPASVSAAASATGTGRLPSQTLAAATTNRSLAVSNDIVIPADSAVLPGTNGSTEFSNERAKPSGLDLARIVLHEDPDVAASLYDVLLDLLLYQPSLQAMVGSVTNGSATGSNSNSSSSGRIPPAGLSQSGVESLPVAVVLHDRTRLLNLKLAILDLIAPHKRFALFQHRSDADNKDDNTITAQYLNISRTVALLVVATGDVVTTVSEKATAFLKQHLDTARGKSDIGSPNRTDTLGVTMSLACEFLALCLGQVHAQSVATKSSSSSSPSNHDLGVVDGPNADIQATQQQVLSTKRRPVDESTVGAVLLAFVGSKVLTDHPTLLDSCDPSVVVEMIGLAAQATSRSLTSAGGSSVTLTKLRGKPYIAAAELLSAVAIRLSTYYDSAAGEVSAQVEALLARCLVTACSVLTSFASSAAAAGSLSSRAVAVVAGSNDGSVAVRDACYGAVATVSRSRLALSPALYLFNGGAAAFSATGASTENGSSVETATLLFRCTALEEERLRPRAVAALDSLLAAYCRIYVSEKEVMPVEDANGPTSMETDENNQQAQANNPWLATKSASPSPLQCESGLKVDKVGLAKSLLPLLWNAAQHYQSKSSRVASARWASDLLKHLDLVGGYHLLCFLAGDPDVTSASIARDGLGLLKETELADDNISVLDSSSNGALPDFGCFVEKIFPKSRSHSSDRRLVYWEFSLKGKAATLRCGLNCLLNDLYGGENEAVAVYLAAIVETLRDIPGETSIVAGDASSPGGTLVDLLDECAVCLLATLSASQFARSQIATSEVEQSATCHLREIESLSLKANSSRARRHFSAAVGKVVESSFADQQTVEDLLTWISQSNLDRSLRVCAQNLSDLERQSASISLSHGSAFLGARLVRAFRLRTADLQSHEAPTELQELWHSAASILTLLGKGLTHKEDIVGNACADSLSIALSYDTKDSPALDALLYQSSVSVLSSLAQGLGKFGHSDTVNPTRAVKIARAAGICLSATTKYSDSGSHDPDQGNLALSRIACVDALFELIGSMAYRKEEEIAIVTGEALVDFADAYSPDNVVWSHNDMDWPSSFDINFAKQLPPHEQVLYVLLRKIFAASSPHKRTACAPALLAVVARAARNINLDPASSRRCLVQSLVRHLDEVQSVFLTLLADSKSNQFSRESSCLGLAACRALIDGKYDVELSADEFNHKLLRAFGQTTNFGTSAMMETPAQAAERRAAEGATGRSTNEVVDVVEREVGGASGIGEAALGAYREMAAASVSLERHDVMYALLFLSISHPYWLSTEARVRYSSSALLGESFMGSKSMTDFRTALSPHLGRLIPRILRACHDPNKQTREQMSALWMGITGGGAEGRQAISRHLLSTVDALLGDVSNKLWRARVGACGALSEIIVGCEWNALGGGGPVLHDDELVGKVTLTAGIRLLRLWNAVIRALDDVQGAVRDSGEKLARSLRALTIRLCDPTLDTKSGGTKPSRQETEKHERQATAAAATSIRWLIRHGLNQTCAEATGVCMSTLVEVVDVVRPPILEPSLPSLVRSLLLSISALEPAGLNNMQLRTENQEGLERARLQLAQAGPLAVALTKCIELIPLVKLQTQQCIAPELDAALRQSSGFATRAATADAVSTLCRTCPTVFLFSGPNSSNPSVRLFRALYVASEQERGEAAKDKMIHALGNLASLCPGSSVRSLALRACKRYTTSAGNYFDSASRRSAASALRAIATRASNQFADGGPGDVWATRVLPVAYLGRKDVDPKVASLWQVVWDEGGSTANVSSSFATRLEEKLLPSLVDECLVALQDVSWARRVAASQALSDLVNSGILAPAPRRSDGAVKVDSSTMTRSRLRAESSSLALRECVRLLTRPRLWDGKVEVMKAAVLLASKWSAAAASTESDTALYGWNETGQPCPYQPFTMGRGSLDDLFEGDGWFTRTDLEAESLPEDLPREAEGADKALIDQPRDATHILFDELDGINDADVKEETDRVQPETSTLGDLSFTGLARFLVTQAMSTDKNEKSGNDSLLPYRTQAFRCFRELLTSIPTEYTDQRRQLYECLASKLLDYFGASSLAKELDKRESPVLIAESILCFEALLWTGIGSTGETFENTDVYELTMILKEAGGSRQPAWTVREAATQCMSQLALTCSDDSIRRPVVVSQMIESAKIALTDRKFWRVRITGLKVLESLVKRTGTKDTKHMTEFQLNLEALLPHKENVLRLVRSCLSDSESSIVSLGSSIVTNMSWWP